MKAVCYVDDNNNSYVISIKELCTVEVLVLVYFILYCEFQMTDRDFWVKYCRAEYLQRTKNVNAAAAEAAEDEELALFLKPDDILAGETRRKVSFLGWLLYIFVILECFLDGYNKRYPFLECFLLRIVVSC